MLVVVLRSPAIAALYVWTSAAGGRARVAGRRGRSRRVRQLAVPRHGQSWNVVWPVLTVVMAAAAGTVWRYVTETRHRRTAWRMFSTYVPASVVGQLEDPRLLARLRPGSRHEVTVLFCDLRGFTPVAADLEPSQVRELLDRYYDYSVPPSTAMAAR